MKSVKLTILMLLFSVITFAQKFNPEIKDGTTMSSYVVMSGSEIEVGLSISSNDSGVGINWVVVGFGEGTFQMSKEAVEKGTKMYGGQPLPGITTLSSNETFALISKAAFKSLKETKAFTYNGFNFINKTSTESVKINGQEADVIFVGTEQGGVNLWILNNPEFPLIIKSNGLPIDLYISDIR